MKSPIYRAVPGREGPAIVHDVIVIGAGNAALCAALSAREQGANVLVLESAPEAERGGNTRFTAGAMRVVYRGISDLQALIPELTDKDISRTDFGAYTREQFLDDLGRVTQYRTDPDLAEILIEKSFETMCWMRSKGVRFAPMYGRQAFKVDGKFKFWGGLTVEAWGGGPGLIESLFAAAARENVDVEYDRRATQLILEDGRVCGVVATTAGRRIKYRASAVVLAAGGFEANTEWRTRYLGPGWDLAKVEARALIRVTVCGWLSTSARWQPAIGPAATLSVGNAMRLNMVTSQSVTAFRSIATRSVL